MITIMLDAYVEIIEIFLTNGDFENLLYKCHIHLLCKCCVFSPVGFCVFKRLKDISIFKTFIESKTSYVFHNADLRVSDTSLSILPTAYVTTQPPPFLFLFCCFIVYNNTHQNSSGNTRDH